MTLRDKPGKSHPQPIPIHQKNCSAPELVEYGNIAKLTYGGLLGGFPDMDGMVMKMAMCLKASSQR